MGLVFARSLVFFSVCTIFGTEAAISQSPESQVAFEGRRVTFTCKAEGNTFWLLNGSVYTFLNEEEFFNNGFSFRDDYQSGARVLKTLSVVASSGNNNTNVTCIAIGSKDGTRNSSLDASLTVIGSPSDVQLFQVNSSAFNVTWTGSYAPDEYEIQNYTIYVINATSGELPHEVLFAKTFMASQNTESYSFVYTVDESHLPLPECSWFIFSVTAANSIGESVPTNVSWQLPLDFGPITKPACVQRSQVDGTTILHVQFDFPKQCRFQEIRYSIDVTLHARGRQPFRSTSTRTYDGTNNSHIEEDIERLVLEEGKVYVASVITERADDRLVTEMDIILCLWTAGPIKLPDGQGLLNTGSSAGVSSAGGGAIALLVICIVASVTLVTASLVILALAYRKTQKKHSQ